MTSDRGEAEVDNHFRRENILNISLLGMYNLFYHTEITIRQETLVREWCWWRRCGFLGQTKSFAKTAEIWFQNVRLDLFRKRVPTLDGFIHKQRSYRHFNATKYVFQCRHCNRTSDRFNPYAHQCSACDSRNYRRVIRSMNVYPPAYGSFTWEIRLRYNKK